VRILGWKIMEVIFCLWGRIQRVAKLRKDPELAEELWNWKDMGLQELGY
jgi:hypothetical protein